MADKPEALDRHAVAVMTIRDVPHLSTGGTDDMMMMAAFRTCPAQRIAPFAAEGDKPEKYAARLESIEIAVNPRQTALLHTAPQTVVYLARRERTISLQKQLDNRLAAGGHLQPRKPEPLKQIIHSLNRNNFHLGIYKKENVEVLKEKAAFSSHHESTA